jgi:hypothetical protein
VKDPVKLKTLERKHQNMHVIVHNHICREFITLVFEVFDRGHHNGSLLRTETGLILRKTPGDKIY